LPPRGRRAEGQDEGQDGVAERRALFGETLKI
jgi:hypothetical protein